MKSMPNILTTLRLLACPLIIYLVINDLSNNQWASSISSVAAKKIFFVFVIASLTDFLDGYLARKKNFKSNFGKFLDPIADKALIITMLTIIIFYGIDLNFHKIALFIIILRELIVSFLRFNLTSLNQSIEVNLLSKYKTFIQILAIGVYLLHSMDLFHPAFHKRYDFLYSISIFLFWFSAYITFITGVQHYKTYLKVKK